MFTYIYSFIIFFQNTYCTLLETKPEFCPVVSDSYFLLPCKILMCVCVCVSVCVFILTLMHNSHILLKDTGDPNFTCEILWRIGEIRNNLMVNFKCQFDWPWVPRLNIISGCVCEDVARWD